MTSARDYQTAALNTAWRELQRKKAVQVVLPSGSGKTRVIAELADRFHRKTGKRVLVVAPMRELVLHAEREVTKYTKLSVSIEMAEQHARDTAVVCATNRSMFNRLKNYKSNTFGLLVFDESDLAAADTYDTIRKHFGKAKVFGTTATPVRHDGRKAIAPVVFKRDLKEQIETGVLARVRRVGVKIAEVQRAKLLAGDFDPKWLDEIFSREKHLHEVVKAMLAKADKRPTLIFGVTVLHAKLLANLFNRYRPGCAQWISGKSKDQHATLDAFRRGEFQFLCNCMLISRGVDIPPVACIGMAAPTLSHTKYMQMLGRGTRQSPGKKNLLVVDFTFNSDVHALDAVDVIAGEGKEAIGVRARERKRPEFDIVDVINEVEGELESDPKLRARIQAKVRVEYRRIKGVAENKKQLLEMARRGEPRPNRHRESIGNALTHYTNRLGGGSSYDSKFDTEIRRLAPQWFLDPTAANKKKLIDMARHGLSRPKHKDGKLGAALSRYIGKTGRQYDAAFDAEIRKLVPRWFIKPAVEDKMKFLQMARLGKTKPRLKARITLRSYIKNDSAFASQLHQLVPHWFVNTADERKKQLIALARRGVSKRPGRLTPLGLALTNYTSNNRRNRNSAFNREIRKLAPQWFVNTTVAGLREKKEQLLNLAANGAKRPTHKTILGDAIIRYSSSTSMSYDRDFYALLMQLAPHWFRRKPPRRV